MRIVEFHNDPIVEFPFLNAGRGAGGFYVDQLPIHVATVDRLPADTLAVVVTADLQGRERFEDSPGGPIRLLGEVLPTRLVTEVLPDFGIDDGKHVSALLAGDFYTVPALDKRGGTGDVTPVWNAFTESFGSVTGVAGNHDIFSDHQSRRPRLPSNAHYLDGDVLESGGIKIAGIGGIIGKATRPNRRSHDDYLATVQRLLDRRPDILLMHDGSDGPHASQRGIAEVRDVLLAKSRCLVIRGHAHWRQPFAEYENGLQVLNVDARVVILTTDERASRAMRHRALDELTDQAQQLEMG